MVDKIGDGYVLVCLNPDFGSVLFTWDGRKHIDISYYLADDDETEIDNFIWAFKTNTNHQLDVALRDEMPRGTGRVVNFAEDILTVEERKDFFDNLSKDGEGLAEHMQYERLLGRAKKVEEGSCSNPGADGETCWPDPPSL